MPADSDRPSAANDPLGCLFDVFTYSLVAAAALCVWVWREAGTGDLPAITADAVGPEEVRRWAVGLFIVCVVGIVLLRTVGMRLYRKMLIEDR